MDMQLTGDDLALDLYFEYESSLLIHCHYCSAFKQKQKLSQLFQCLAETAKVVHYHNYVVWSGSLQSQWILPGLSL